MALNPTITSDAYQPWSEKYSDYTPPMVEILQTSTSVATATSVCVFASGTSSDDMFLNSIQISFLAPTAGAVFSLYIGKTQIAVFPTLASVTPAFYALNFGQPGLMGGTTTTATVSIVGDTSNTATVMFVATGMRKK